MSALKWFVSGAMRFAALQFESKTDSTERRDAVRAGVLVGAAMQAMGDENVDATPFERRCADFMDAARKAYADAESLRNGTAK